MAERADCIVLGAGVVGVSSALHLLRRGRSVALVDRRGPGEETSYGNTGGIEASSALPYAFPAFSKLPGILFDRDSSARADWRHLPAMAPWLWRLYREAQPEGRKATGRSIRPLLARSVEEHKTLIEAAGATQLLRQNGWVKLFRTDAGLAGERMALEFARECGIAFEQLSQAEFAALEPHLKPAYRHAIIYKNSATVTSPGNVTKAYAALFAREGGRIVKGDARTLAQTPEGRWRLATADGTLEAGEVVVAMGPWSMDVLRPLGYRFPLGIKRGYHRHYTATGNAVLTRTIVDAEYGYCIAPMDQGYRITTGAEFTDRDAPPNPVQLDRVLPRARELFALDEPAEPEPWMGRRPCFPDSLPIVDRGYAHKGLWMNFGHGHLGFTLGPVTGRLLAEVMTGQQPVCDPSPYRATRF